MTQATWIGELPPGWQQTYLKYETTFINGAPFKPSDWSAQGTPIIRIENLNGGEDYNFYSGGLDKKYEVKKGDLLFAWSGNIGTSFGPFLWARPGVHYLNQHIFRLEDYRFEKRYFYWLLRGVTSFIESKASGIIGLVHVTKAELGRVAIPLISQQLQISIADYLDTKHREIETFITGKRRLIELFEEQERAIISRAVTRGINLDARMKPSGLDWLGEIPAHWQVRRNQRLFRERIQRGLEGLPILVVSLHTGVSVGQETDDDGRPRRLIEERSTYKFAARGDIAYNMMRMWQGAVGVVPVDGLASPAYVIAKPLAGVNSEYFSYLFRTDIYKREINRNSRGIVSDRNRLYWDDFKQLPSPVPEFTEQESIIEAIGSEKAKIDRAIRTAQREIELICEFRTTLISDAVTGKLDVRTLARREPPL